MILRCLKVSKSSVCNYTLIGKTFTWKQYVSPFFHQALLFTINGESEIWAVGWRIILLAFYDDYDYDDDDDDYVDDHDYDDVNE